MITQLPAATLQLPDHAAAAATAPLPRPEPPLVTVTEGAADLYADLLECDGDGEGGVLLKTQLTEVRGGAKSVGVRLRRCMQALSCTLAPLLPRLPPCAHRLQLTRSLLCPDTHS